MWYETVTAESWSDIVDHYRVNYGAGCWGKRYLPMIGLVETIAGSPYAPILFGRRTSPYPMDNEHQGQLDLSRTREYVKRHQVLAVSYVPEEDWFLFEYYEAVQTLKPKPWATACAIPDGFAKLEWVLNKRLRWLRSVG